MKVSYKVLKKYIPDIKSPEEVAQDLVMHTAEVEGIHSEASAFEHIVYGVIKSVEAHPNADSLRVCMVDIGESELSQIVCGGSNLIVGQAVAVAKIGASVLWHGQGEPVVMKKTAIRGVESSGMICAAEEIGLKDEFPSTDEKEIVDLSHISAKAGTPLAEVLGKDDVILEIDNKAINHRPDLFSHIGVAREVAAIAGKKLDYTMASSDFSHLDILEIKNDIPHVVKRYMGLKASGVANIASPDYVLDVLRSHDIVSKGLLVDITNYSLYLYGQPTHCFDAAKVTGNIHIRFAKQDEAFHALNGKSYTLSPTDIVIADEVSVLALGGVIGGSASAVSETTTDIIIESAWFDQAIIRKTGKRLGLRTDSLNVFEKDLVASIRETGPSLIIQELQKNIPSLKLEAFGDVYPEPQAPTYIDYDLDFICRLIGKEYSSKEALEILARVGIEEKDGILAIPLWRKDLTTKADIAEEIARLDGYQNIQITVPRVQLGAVSQKPLYKAKRELRNFLVARGFFEMYTYSFVYEGLMQKVLGSTSELVTLKNALSAELSHMRGSLIPNLLQALEDNKSEYKQVKLFECEKVFEKNAENIISEHYELSLLEQISGDVAYYEVQNTLKDLFAKLAVFSYSFAKAKNVPHFAHAGRSSEIIVRGKTVGYLGEIHPKVVKNFGLSGRIGFVQINLGLLEGALFGLVAAREISSFQENNFDLNFVIEKNAPGSEIQKTIEKSDTLIQKVELLDIYESEEKLPGKRSLTFKIYIQSMSETLSDGVKSKLIDTIVQNVEKKGGKLR